MRSITGSVFVGLLVGSLGAVQLFAQPRPAPTSALEGSRWAVTVTPDEQAKQQGEKPFEDTLIFTQGKVSMSACAKYGFASSTYRASQAGEHWTFQTEQLSRKEGKTVWNAVTTGDAISGTLVWTKKNGAILHYTFEGKKLARSKAS